MFARPIEATGVAPDRDLPERESRRIAGPREFGRRVTCSTRRARLGRRALLRERFGVAAPAAGRHSRRVAPRRGTSRSASAMRVRVVAPQVSVTAPQPATKATAVTSARPRRTNARQRDRRHPSPADTSRATRPGARQSTGRHHRGAAPRSAGRSPPAARAARPITTCPALAPAIRMPAAASAIASCHAIHSPTLGPLGGNAMPRARSRSANGPERRDAHHERHRQSARLGQPGAAQHAEQRQQRQQRRQRERGDVRRERSAHRREVVRRIEQRRHVRQRAHRRERQGTSSSATPCPAARAVAPAAAIRPSG